MLPRITEGQGCLEIYVTVVWPLTLRLLQQMPVKPMLSSQLRVPLFYITCRPHSPLTCILVCSWSRQPPGTFEAQCLRMVG